MLHIWVLINIIFQYYLKSLFGTQTQIKQNFQKILHPDGLCLYTSSVFFVEPNVGMWRMDGVKV